MKWVIEERKKGKKLFWPSAEMRRKAWISNASIYAEAEKNPIAFWEKLAKQGLKWYKPWKKAYVEKPPFFRWFVGAKLNASYNCLDRHLPEKKDKIALVWIPEPTREKEKKITYQQLYKEVNKAANVLKELGIRKGDRVGIYLPMIPEAIVAMLACARIGAMHSVVFSAFSAAALKMRLIDAKAKLLITVDGYYRRGKLIELKKSADEAVRGTAVKKVLVVKRAGNKVIWKKHDRWWHSELAKAASYCEPTEMKGEDPLFILYTSGTTGKPKGVVLGTAGYCVQAYWTTLWDFDLHDDDKLWCTADIGWITGHTYVCYGPLLCGSSSLFYEGAPDFPNAGRWWKIIEKHKIAVLYTAPTALRMFMLYGEKWPRKYDLSSLRILGTVGEPIDEDTWFWYFRNIGKNRCPIIDTWWQTETGGTLINALPGIGPFISTVAGRSFPGIRHAVINEKGKKLQAGKIGFLVQERPFAPGMLQGIWKDPYRYKETYFKEFGNKLYFTGDGAFIDKQKNFRLTGRVDDVLKVAGHRLSTAELENAIDEHTAVDECAVVPKPHAIKGEVPIAFVVLKKGKPSIQLEKELIGKVEKAIGPTARPSAIYFVEDLPKTRSGKIMRRILKSLLRKEKLGDLSTLQNPECIAKIKKVLR